DHIDGERHVQLIPGIFETVVAAARRHAIPYVRAGREMRSGRLPRPGELGIAGPGLAKSLILGALTHRDRPRLGDGIRSADRFARYRYSGRLDLVLHALLSRQPPPAGVTEIMVHPGIPEESRGIDLGNPDVERYLASADRRREMEACIEARHWTSGWRLTTFGELGREPATT